MLATLTSKGQVTIPEKARVCQKSHQYSVKGWAASFWS